ncbi:phosphatidylinositol glycan anchor biosynthesis class U protein [Ceratobasidium sp. AG-Ba]|nr:phosphatidylinositol glycan anchor biosynthesis class U protein [Ceratobasidium sp. AG-Ba]
MKVVVVIAGLVALRLAIFTTPIPRYIQDDYQLASAVTSIARLKEGVFLLQRGIDPYTGGVFLHSPLLLALFSTVFPLSGTGTAVLWSLLDGLTSWCLVSLWRLRTLSKDDRKEVLIAAIYLLNPYTLLTTLARSTATIDTALTALALLLACRKQTGPALLALAVLVHVSLPSVLVVAPLIMVLGSTRAPISSLANPDVKGEDGKLGVGKVLEWGVYVGLLGYAGNLVVGGWGWFWRSWGAIVTLSDATPNCGLWWYFFTEMFDHYRPFFLFAFSAHPLIYIAPMCMKFKHDPFYAAYLLLGVSTTLKSYPTLADAGLFISLTPLFPETFAHLRHPLPTFLLHLHSALLMPLASHLWLSQGTGNANFLYAATLVYGLANGAMVIDAVWSGLRVAFVTKDGDEVVQL